MTARTGALGVATALALCLGVMAGLKVHTLHTAYYDLGVFEHALWDMAFNGQWRWLFYGHVQFFLPMDAFLYRLAPSGCTLVLKQALVLGLSGWLVYLLPIDRRRWLPLVAYALFFPVWYLALFDYHPEHMVIPLGLGFYCAALRGRMALAAACAVAIALVKEPYALTGVFCGLYLVVRYRKYGWGLCCIVVCAATRLF